VPHWGRKLEDVDRVAFQDILENRSVVDIHWRDVLRISLVMGEIRIAQLLLREALRQTQGHRAALAGKAVDQQPKPLRAARHLVEKHRRPVIRRNHDVGGEPDFFLPGSAPNGLQFAELFGFVHPFTKIGEGDMRLNF
jgi:hypothetical protein